MVNKRWFSVLLFLIMFFLLILLMNSTKFVFVPFIQYLGAVAFPIIGAGILYYLTKPLMHFLEKRKVHRIASIIIIFITIIVVVALFLLFIWPIARDQSINLFESIPTMIVAVENFIDYWQEHYTLIPDAVLDPIISFTDELPTHIETVVNYLFGFIGGFIGQVISIAAGLVLIPFFLFFMLKDGDKLVPFITHIFKKKKANNIRSLLGKLDAVLGSFIQGQLIVSFVVGVLLLIGYLIIGLDYAVALALFGMVTNVIPYLGPFLAVTPALIVGGIQDPYNLIWVSIIMIVAQQFESNIVSPNVMGQALNLHPLTIITVILAAGSIAGFLGIVFAVPAYAVIRTIIVHFYETYVDSKKNKEEALL
ncbi:AI-2E family transporter [Oceanobacillus chungangensis]|uniref:AI-2E family transporter n=1 Tax=Oceanobacillus chungangensis TaxID=1229152 RepID=A0A3D8Q0I7_9BACI|nr:AI-2E family transporter [Oceanobacillus chungangensis]RDW20485.1 AI-2E family transporter [Oceanobacillus chungangensis]